ncbi:hypothetical protein AAEU32_02325 [Pseudoalteromonas sp. SSDWG2]|uniref:hypothetical protein n=1 Tax=Pseudoalteromonas sp. SSDWG2 TaxID=3139391 RepID=UPI003BAB0467
MTIKMSLAVLCTMILLGCSSTHDGQQASNEDGMICELKKPTGSNIPKRVCMTKEQKEAQEKAGQEYINQQRNRATTGGLTH